MIEWHNIKDKKPQTDRMCLIVDYQGMITQAYVSEDYIFAIPWGEPYRIDNQPKFWAKINWPLLG